MSRWDDLPLELKQMILNINKRLYLEKIKNAHREKMCNTLQILDYAHRLTLHIDNFMLQAVDVFSGSGTDAQYRYIYIRIKSSEYNYKHIIRTYC